MRLFKRLDGGLRGGSQRCLGFLEDRLAPFTLAALLAVLAGSIWCWDSWRGDESNGTGIRNLVLIMAAIGALPLAIWRSKVAERQAETAQLGLLNERYQKGAEMLGSDLLVVRLGGIYALARLAREHPGDHHLQIMSLLCAFVRHPDRQADEVLANPIGNVSSMQVVEFDSGLDEEGNDRLLPVREDVQEVMTVFRHRSKAQIEIDRLNRWNLSQAYLVGATLIDIDLFGASLDGANLTGACLWEANLSRAFLMNANLTGVNLATINLTGAILIDANLTGANMRGCEGLIQRQIDEARAEPDNPPDLEGVVDAETGKPLVWRDKAAKQT